MIGYATFLHIDRMSVWYTLWTAYFELLGERVMLDYNTEHTYPHWNPLLFLGRVEATHCGEKYWQELLLKLTSGKTENPKNGTHKIRKAL